MDDADRGRLYLALPLLLAFCAALAALTIIATTAFFTLHPGLPASSSPFGNVVSVARTYLFRTAVRNTAVVITAVSMAIFLIARLIYHRGPLRVPTLGWARVSLAAIGISPLFLPVPYAAHLWGPLFTQLDISARLSTGLLAIAIVEVWRLWPLAILFALFLPLRAGKRSALIIALSAAIVTLVDVGSPLVLTGGEPYNATHLWATWSFHTIWVSRHWAFGAVMYCGLAVITGAVGSVLWLAGRHGGSRDGVRTRENRPGNLLIAIGAGSALVPLLWTVPELVRQWWADAPAQGFAADYASWVAASLAALVCTSAVAGAVTVTASATRFGRRPRVVGLCFIAGLAVLPVWNWIGLHLAGNGQWTFALFSVVSMGATAGLIALWPVASAHNGCNSRRAACTDVLVIVAISALVVGNQFGLSVFAAQTWGMLDLAAAPSGRLSGAASSTELAIIVVATYALVFMLTMAVSLALRRIGRQTRSVS